jgi:hypothetical protein
LSAKISKEEPKKKLEEIYSSLKKITGKISQKECKNFEQPSSKNAFGNPVHKTF